MADTGTDPVNGANRIGMIPIRGKARLEYYEEDRIVSTKSHPNTH